ncbi:MAG: hypothetical protein SynsKO_36700 [Synoicihabitans sp.]
MIRAESAESWILVTHPDHARLAGQFADAWGNDEFPRPELFEAIRYAVYHHDDGWIARDAAPQLTPQGVPEAFTRDLVGAYSAFEEIDLPAYLEVRRKATEEVASANALAGVLTSMHTVNLLTEQADESTILPEHRESHAKFVAAQKEWQETEISRLDVAPALVKRGFEFLQCCDSLSLMVCSGFDRPRPLRHNHPDSTGIARELICSLVEPNKWQIDPWPCGSDFLHLKLPYRIIPKAECESQERYASAFARAKVQEAEITLV